DPVYDLWETPEGDLTNINLGCDQSTPAVPADFFYPGSDPFVGQIAFTGEPLVTDPPNILGPTDTIIKRARAVYFPECGTEDQIDIEIVALNLKSVEPITVNGAGGPEQWDVRMCLSDLPQIQGSMEIYQACENGGYFNADLPVYAKLIFTQVDPPYNQEEYDLGLSGASPISYNIPSGNWMFSDPGLEIYVSPGDVIVENCDFPGVTIGPSAVDLIPGIFGDPCIFCSLPGDVFSIPETEMLADCAAQIIQPPQVVYEPVYDLWQTPPEEDITNVDLGCDPSTPPIPADYFGPGSDPFEGRITFAGEPLVTDPPGILGPTDTIIKRVRAANFPECGTQDQIGIEIVALNLISVAPIIVTYNGGQDPEEWDVRMCLSDLPQLPGSMTIIQNCEEGGYFYADLPVYAKLIFSKTDNPQFQEEFDIGLYGTSPIVYNISSSNWLFTDPGLGIYVSPGDVIVENCDVPSVTIGASAVDLIPGIFGDLCIMCPIPPTVFSIPITDMEAECARQIIWPPHATGCDYVVGDFNGSGSFNISDIIDGFSKLKTGSPEADLICECPPGSGIEWAVAIDVNSSCAFNISDIIDGFSKLKTGSPDLEPCADCPPIGRLAPGDELPLVIPLMNPKEKDVSNGAGD
ncbi:MAG: hypothetical protein V3W18_02250, partial [candidate division Zixibacteria bacterium]